MSAAEALPAAIRNATTDVGMSWREVALMTKSMEEEYRAFLLLSSSVGGAYAVGSGGPADPQKVGREVHSDRGKRLFVLRF